MPKYCRWLIGFIILLSYTHITWAYDDATLGTPNLVVKSKKVVVGTDANGLVYQNGLLYINSTGGVNCVKTEITATCDDTMFYTEKALKTAIIASLNQLILDAAPSGAIMAWDSNSDPPVGWALCDGTSYGTETFGTTTRTFYTPNLNRSIFILDTATTHPTMGDNTSTVKFVKSVGGYATTGGAHNPSFTSALLPAHTHNFRGSSTTGVSTGGTWSNDAGFMGDATSTQNLTSDSYPITAVGETSSHENVPPYRSCRLIMKKYK